MKRGVLIFVAGASVGALAVIQKIDNTGIDIVPQVSQDLSKNRKILSAVLLGATAWLLMGK